VSVLEGLRTKFRATKRKLIIGIILAIVIEIVIPRLA